MVSGFAVTPVPADTSVSADTAAPGHAEALPVVLDTQNPITLLEDRVTGTINVVRDLLLKAVGSRMTGDDVASLYSTIKVARERFAAEAKGVIQDSKIH